MRSGLLRRDKSSGEGLGAPGPLGSRWFQVVGKSWKCGHPCGLRKSCGFHPDYLVVKNDTLEKMTLGILFKMRQQTSVVQIGEHLSHQLGLTLPPHPCGACSEPILRAPTPVPAGRVCLRQQPLHPGAVEVRRGQRLPGQQR